MNNRSDPSGMNGQLTNDPVPAFHVRENPERQLIREVKLYAAELECSLHRLGKDLSESGLATSTGDQIIKLAELSQEIQTEFNRLIQACIFLQRQTP